MRQPDVIRPIKLTTTLPEDIRAKLDLHLWSDLEGRVPKGAYQRFFIDRIRDFVSTRPLDLSEYFDLPGPTVVRGSPATIEILQRILRGTKSDNP